MNLNSPDNLIDKNELDGFWDYPVVKPVKDIIVTGVNDGWALIKSPLKWDSTAFFVLPSIALGVYFLMIIDKPITRSLSGNKKYSDSFLVEASEIYGRNRTSELSAAGFAIAGLALNEKNLIRIGLEIYESYYFTNNINSVIKRLFGRARPYEDKGNYHFDPFNKKNNPRNSLPSGHAALSFSLSTVIASHLDNTYLKALAYTPAVLTCLSRVYQNQHWASDVFLGAAVGYFIGSFVTERHKSPEQDFFSLSIDEQGRIGVIIPVR